MRLQGSYHVADEYAEVPSCFYSELCCFIYTFRNIFLIFFSKVFFIKPDRQHDITMPVTLKYFKCILY